MAEPVKLHPKIRERKEARISASALAEYITAAPDRQDELLHDQRFKSGYVAPKHQQALSVIRAFCSDVKRDWSRYERGRDALLEKSIGDSFSPSQREEAARCVETLDLFRLSAGNAFAVLGTALFDPPPFNLMTINRLPVSVVPDLMVGSGIPIGQGEKAGLIFIRVQKRPNPDECKTAEKSEERRVKRRETLAYMLVLGDMLLRANGVPDACIDRKRIRGWDVRLGEEVHFPSDRVSRERRIQAACGQIARLWGSIEPKRADLA